MHSYWDSRGRCGIDVENNMKQDEKMGKKDDDDNKGKQKKPY